MKKSLYTSFALVPILILFCFAQCICNDTLVLYQSGPDGMYFFYSKSN